MIPRLYYYIISNISGTPRNGISFGCWWFHTFFLSFKSTIKSLIALSFYFQAVVQISYTRVPTSVVPTRISISIFTYLSSLLLQPYLPWFPWSRIFPSRSSSFLSIQFVLYSKSILGHLYYSILFIWPYHNSCLDSIIPCLCTLFLFVFLCPYSVHVLFLTFYTLFEG